MSKKIITLFAIAFAMVTVLAGCDTKVPETPDVPDEGEVEEGPNMRPIPMDTAMFRGIVTEVSADSISMRMASGRDYGVFSLTLAINEGTNIDPTLEEIAQGDYVEVYYGGEGEDATAIYMLKLKPAETVVFNGEILSVNNNDDGELMSLTVQRLPINGGETIVFNIGEETQIYMDKAELVEGKTISIYHSGAVALSEPAQGFAIEISGFVPIER